MTTIIGFEGTMDGALVSYGAAAVLLDENRVRNSISGLVVDIEPSTFDGVTKFGTPFEIGQQFETSPLIVLAVDRTSGIAEPLVPDTGRLGGIVASKREKPYIFYIFENRQSFSQYCDEAAWNVASTLLEGMLKEAHIQPLIRACLVLAPRHPALWALRAHWSPDKEATTRTAERILEANAKLTMDAYMRALDQVPNTEYVFKYDGGMTGSGDMESWVRATLRDPLANDRQKRNAMRILRRFGGKEIANVSVVGGRDLRGERFAGQRLLEGDFTGADLTGANFADADLTRVKFTNARLATADLTRAILKDANLEGADLSFARLPGANLQGASMLRARMRYAKLVGAALDPHSLDGCDTTGSALPGLSVPVPTLAAPYGFFIGVVFSSDGALCVTLGTGRVFETRTRLELCRVPGVRKTVAFSEKGDMLLLADSRGEVKFWDLVAGKVLRTVQGPAKEGSSGNFTWRYACAIALHPASMVGATQVHDGTVHIWNLQNGAVERIFPPVSPATRHIHEDGTRVVFNHDGSLLAAAHEGGEVCLWDTRTGEAKGVLKSGSGRILGIGFDSDGCRLFSVSDMNESIFVYDIPTLSLLRQFESHLVECAAISPNGAMVGSVSNNGDVEVWDVETGESLWRRNGRGTGGFSCIAFSADSTSLVTSRSTELRWWNAATGESAPLGRSGVSSHVAGIAAKDASIVTGSGDGAVSIWDFRRPGPLVTRQYDDRIQDLACAGDGSIACAYAGVHSSKLQHVLEVLDSELRVRWSHVRSAGSGCLLRFSPDSRFLADCRFYEGMRLCSAADGTVVWTLPNQDSNTSNYGGLAFLPDGQSIIWGRGKNLVMLDLATGHTLRDLHSFDEAIESVAADPVGKRIAVVAGNQLICLEVATGTEWKVQVGRDQSGGWTWRGLLEFSPDGRLLLRGSGAEARVWQVGDDQPLCVLGNEGRINSLAFVEGGSLVAIGSEDGGVRLWDVVSGQLRGTVFSAADGWATFTPSGRYSAQGDLTGRFWLRIGLVRFEPGELDDFLPGLRMGDSDSIV